MKFKVLGIGSGMLAVLAVTAFGLNRWMNTPDVEERVGRPIMPAIEMARAVRIRIVSHDNEINIRSGKNGQWTVSEQNDFPVDRKKLNQLLFKLANSKIVHKVTGKKEKLAGLALLTAEENDGKLEKEKTASVLSILDAEEKPLYQLLMGKERRGSGGMAFGGIYVRYPDSTNAYLISETLLYEYTPEDWIDAVVFDEDAGKVLQSIRIEKSGSPPLLFRKGKPEDQWSAQNFKGEPEQSEIENLANQLAGLDIFKTAPGDADPGKMGRKKTGRVRFQFFDKRSFLIDIGEEKAEDEYRYLTIRADLDPSVTDEGLREKVRAFNERYEGRLLAVYDWDGGRMLRERKDFLKKK